MSSKFWWISTRASPDLPTGFIYQIHCEIYGPSKICHGCHESWVMSDDDIIQTFWMHDIQKWTSAHLLDQAFDVIWTQAANLQKLPKDHQSKRPWSCTETYERTGCRSTFDAFGKPLLMLTVWCWGTASAASKSCTRKITQPWICEAGFFELLNLLEYLGPKGSEDISIYIVCAMFVLYPCHTRHKQRVISFHIGIPWLSILELINQGSFFSTSGAMYNKVPASSRDSLAD